MFRLFQILQLFAWFPAFFGIIGLLFTFTDKKGDVDSFIYSLFLIAPLVIVKTLFKKTSMAGKGDFDSQASAAGANHKTWGSRSGIAISAANTKIVLSQDGKTRTYDLSDIRKWTSNLDTSWVIAGTGAVAAGAQMRAAADRYENTGLFVSVKDIDHPEWQVRIQDKNELNRWFELMTQIVNEGIKI